MKKSRGAQISGLGRCSTDASCTILNTPNMLEKGPSSSEGTEDEAKEGMKATRSERHPLATLVYGKAHSGSD